MSRTARFVRTPPVAPHVITAEVLKSEQISPSFQRVTIGGDALANFTYVGYDQWFRLFIPKVGQDEIELPTRTSGLWYAQYLATPRERRPWVRNYTVRAWRENNGSPEMDIDFVLHGAPKTHSNPAEPGNPAGPGASFAATVTPGTRVGILDQGLGFEPARAEKRMLLVAEESGLPAVAGILETLPADIEVEAIIEVPTEADRQELSSGPKAAVHWLYRGESHDAPGKLALEFAKNLPRATEPVYCYVVGEQARPTSLRRHLVAEQIAPKNAITFQGYWRVGRAAI